MRSLLTSRLAVPVLIFVLSLPAVTVRLYASDEIEYFAYLRSMWFDHDLSFDNEYRYFYDRDVGRGMRFREAFLDTTTATGLRVNLAPVGSAILWTPFYAAADVGVRVARAFGSGVERDGFSTPYIAAVTYGSAIYGFLALLLSGAVIRRVVGGGEWVVAAAWLGTPLLFYMYIAPGFSHACSAFVVAAFLYTWLRVRETWSMAGVAVLGALAALMGMVREQDAFVAIGPALDFLVAGVRALGQRRWTVGGLVLRAFVGVAAFLVCIVPQAAAYLTLNGRLGPSPIVAQKMFWTAPYAWKVLTSPENGLFFWSPITLLGFAGLLLLAIGRAGNRQTSQPAANDSTWLGQLALLMVLTQIYVVGSFATWMGAGSFGQRRLVGLTVLFALGLASVFQVCRVGWRRWAFGGAALVCLWWNLGLVVQFGTGLMDRQKMDPPRNAYTTFVRLPVQLPSLAYRYFVDRESFYEKRRGAAR